MSVKFTRPEINIREALDELNKPSGIAGEAMLRAETPQEQFNLIGAGRKNLIINGDFQVWQRGTSFSLNTSSVTYTADRWAYYNPSDTGAVNLIEEVVNGTMRNVLKGTFDSPNNSHRTIRQRLEFLKRFSGQTVTMSFWAKSNVDVDYTLEYRTWYRNSVWNDYVATSLKFTTVWKYYTSTFSIPDISSQTIVDSESMLEVFFRLAELKAHELYLSQVQLELGSVATPFEHRSYGEELNLCMRYYQTSPNLFTNEGVGAAYSTTKIRGNYERFFIPMRTSPSITVAGSGQPRYYKDLAWVNSSAYSYTNISNLGFAIDMTGSGFTARDAFPIEYDWAATAEL